MSRALHILSMISCFFPDLEKWVPHSSLNPAKICFNLSTVLFLILWRICCSQGGAIRKRKANIMSRNARQNPSMSRRKPLGAKPGAEVLKDEWVRGGLPNPKCCRPCRRSGTKYCHTLFCPKRDQWLSQRVCKCNSKGLSNLRTGSPLPPKVDPKPHRAAP